MPDGSVHSCYLTSYADTVRSVAACKGIPYRFLSLPHRGILSDEDAGSFFDKAITAHQDCHNFILEMQAKGLGQDAMLEAFEKRFRSKVLATYQPREAFLANARSIISCSLRDEGSTLMPQPPFSPTGTAPPM
jgi:hypothetical protein